MSSIAIEMKEEKQKGIRNDLGFGRQKVNNKFDQLYDEKNSIGRHLLCLWGGDRVLPRKEILLQIGIY